MAKKSLTGLVVLIKSGPNVLEGTLNDFCPGAPYLRRTK